jgi:ATP/maltotriose-dependent transcriptional regulator MalT
MAEKGDPVDSRGAGARSAREHFQERRWQSAYEAFVQADAQRPLDAGDLEAWATAAALTAHRDVHQQALERAYRARLAAGSSPEAARDAFWLGFRLLTMGCPVDAGAWFARSQKLVDSLAADAPEAALLMLPKAFRQIMSGDFEGGSGTAQRMYAIAERSQDGELMALSQNLLARALLRSGQLEQGFAALDESMLLLREGQVSPLVLGVTYCGVIATCQRVFAFDRARLWTQTLENWCAAQPEMAAFQGQCQVHQSEVSLWAGHWRTGLLQVEGALQSGEREALPEALYQKAELLRLSGELDAAEATYSDAADQGRDPQPGLALLWAARGDSVGALAALERALVETSQQLARSRLLPALVEVALDARDVPRAADACSELEEVARAFPLEAIEALAAQARGRLNLASGDAPGALGPLRRACHGFRNVEVPYLEAQVQLDLGLACWSLGDRQGARVLFDAARSRFEALGATIDLQRLARLRPDVDREGTPTGSRSDHIPTPAFGLTPRELEVLGQLAQGKTNKEIASVLGVSEKTIDRHVSNLFTKLGVNTRAAATALAYRQRLLS